MYNADIKEEFLNEYPEKTRISYRRIFDKSEQNERALGKDLYDFNLNEIENIMYALTPLTNSASYTYGTQIIAYVKWALYKEYPLTNTNLLLFQKPNFFNKFVDQNKQMYMTESNLRKIEDNLVNAQDAVVLRLIFEGVFGSGLSELKNLKRQDVNFNENKLSLINSKGERREHVVSDRAIQLIGEALDQEIYRKKNGEMTSEYRVSNESELDESDYVVRPTNTNIAELSAPVTLGVVYKRIRNVAALLGGLDIPAIKYFTSKNIFRSGVIYYGKQLLNEYGELGSKQYEMIGERFNINTTYSIRYYCNQEEIEKLYGAIELN